MTSVVFHVPEINIEISADLARVLINELAVTPDRPGVIEARQARERIEHALAGGHRHPERLIDPEHVAVLRALDNLRRRGELHSELQELRSRLLGSGDPGIVSYSVRFAHDPLRTDRAFTSYAGRFAVGDRLILHGGDVGHVVRVEEDARNARERLVLEKD
jgi:hypothetical protein